MWAMNTGVEVFLLVLLIARKNYRAYPYFAFYLFVNLALSILLFSFYRRWGFSTSSSWFFAWGMQAVAICARALAVAEVCRHLLARYLGIWALAWRVQLACAGLVLLYSGLAARHQWQLALPSADRGLELAIAAGIAMLFLFARYYHVRAERADRLLAIGFFLYSCFWALNNTFLERYLYRYATAWSLLGMLSFLASLSLWTWALSEKLRETPPEPEMLSEGVYRTLLPEINVRLKVLNENLKQFWYPEVKQP